MKPGLKIVGLVVLGSGLSLLAGCSDEPPSDDPPRAQRSPTVTISEPTDDSSVYEGTAVAFVASASDPDDGPEDLIIRWTSSVDGLLSEGELSEDGESSFETADLSLDEHEITVEVEDPGGSTGDASITLTVIANTNPSVTIESPQGDALLYADQPIDIEVLVVDLEHGPDELSVDLTDGDGSSLASNLEPASDGSLSTELSLAVGEWTVTATATDSAGDSGSDSVSFTVISSNTAPTCEITEPEDGAAVPAGDLVVFRGVVGDAELEPSELDVTLSSSIDGGLGNVSPSAEGDFQLGTSFLSPGVHTITLLAEDDQEAVCEHSISLILSSPPTALVLTPSDNQLINDTETVAMTGLVGDAEDEVTALGAEWTSDVDGSLGISVPDSSGAVSLDATGLTAGAHLLTLTATDSGGLTASDSVAISINASPSAPAILLDPPAPLTADDLSALITTASVDPDSGPSPISYAYLWTKDGTPQPAWDGFSTVPASETTQGELWVVSVTASDGAALSTPTTAAVTIGNTPPSVASATLSPAVGLESSVFTVLPSGWEDADGDTEGYLYQWYADASAVVGATLDSWTPAGQEAGTSITCEVTPNDGASSGTPVIAGPSIINTAPAVVGLSITPTTAYEDTVLTASYALLDDPDLSQSPTVSWQWSVGGLPIPGATQDTLTGTDFDKGDSVTVSATPDDGLEEGSTEDAGAVLILNTLPSITGLTISPASGNESTTFSCLPSGWSDSDGDTEDYQYLWTVSGQPSVTTATITGSHFDVGDSLNCTATPWDGEELGAALTSPTVAVAGSVPSITAVDILPGTGGELATFTCTPSGWADDDGDPESYSFLWTVNGNPSLTTDSIDGAVFDKGDSLACTATPLDAVAGNGTPVTSASLVVVNTLPSITGVTLTPSTPTEATIVTCSPAGWSDPDPADSPGYLFQWYINGLPSVTTEFITGSLYSEGDSLSCTATPDDGEGLGAPITSPGTFVANSPPSLASAAISPGGGGETTTFTCDTSGVVDLDPADTVTLAYQWTVGGLPSVTTQTIDGSSFDAGDVIQCTATPHDEAGPGTPATSNTVTIDNSEPSIASVTVTPGVGNETTNFSCDASGWLDADGDPPGYTYQWYVGVTPSVTTQTIGGLYFDKGDSLYCMATPFDGQAYGSPLSSNIVVVQNAPPSVASATVSPSSGTEATIFSCIASGWSDPDGDPAGYQWEWTIGPTVVGTAMTLDGSSFNKGDALVCTAIPWDGQDTGTPVSSSSVTVSNTPPSISAVTVSPTTVYTNSSLSALPVGWSDPDPADIPDFMYEWFVDTAPAGGNSSSLGGSWFAKGQVVTVQVTPQDSESSGTPVTSAPLTVLNSAPGAPTLTITPAAPSSDDALTCNVSTPSADLDGDTVTYSYLWSVDSVPSLQTGPTVSAATTAGGEEWTCTVTPNDGETNGPSASVTATVSPTCQSLDLDGIDDWVTMPNLPLAGDWTAELWVKFDSITSAPGADYLFTQLNGLTSCGAQDCILFSAQDGGWWSFRWHGEPTATETNWNAAGYDPVGEWHHVAVTFDSVTLERVLYVDGVERAASMADGPYLGQPVSAFTFIGRGANPLSSYTPLDGELSWFRMSDTVRYTADFVPTVEETSDSDTVALYLFEDITSPTVTDASGSGNDATITGGNLQMGSCVELDCDADGDGSLDVACGGDDCDDSDPSSTSSVDDADCDGVLATSDCDDTNPAIATSCAVSAASTTFGPLFLDANSGYTVEYWTYRETSTDYGTFFRTWNSCDSSYGYNSFHFHNSGLYVHGYPSGPPINPNTNLFSWSHVAVTFSSTGTQLFVDGVHMGSSSPVGNAVCSAAISAGTGFWLDEMRLSSSALYAPSSNFTPPATFTDTSSTVALFDFSDPGSVATDLTGNGYDIVWTSPPTRGPGH